MCLGKRFRFPIEEENCCLHLIIWGSSYDHSCQNWWEIQDSEEKIEAFAEQLVSQFGRKEPLVLVVSAIGDSTDQLQAAIRKRRPDISDLTVEPDRYFTRFGGDESRYGSIS